MTIRPYKLVNRTERGILAARLTEGLRRWNSRYAPDDAGVTCELVFRDEDTAQIPKRLEWILATRQSAPLLAVGLPDDWPRGLSRHVIGKSVALDPAGLQLMRELGVGLLEELGQSVLDAVPATHPAESSPVWSRATSPAFAGGPADAQVFGYCRLGDSLDLVITIWPDTVQRWLAVEVPRRVAAAPVEPLSGALQARVVVLDGIAGEAELALEELTTLAVGDVIRLNRKISEPLQLRVRGGGVVCAARLGSTTGRTALQLT
jgi:hypothetical protein